MDVSVESAPVTTAVERLPERLRAAGTSLFVSDSLCALLIVAVFSLAGDGAPAFLTLTAVLLVALATGRYRWSFAATPGEEWYAAAGMALLGTMVGTLLAIALHFEWFVAVASGVMWTGLAGAAAMFMTRTRRGERAFASVIDRVHERPVSTGGAVERGVIRMLDAVFATTGLIVLSPLLLLIALVVTVDDGLPVLFAQTRVSRDDGDFTMYKFRTMRRDAGSNWAAPGDTRITRSGGFLRRSSLDELPQLWNVVRGDMSLVGPRPEMREYADAFAREHLQYSQRHIIQPGLTGWAQLRMPRNLQPSDAPDVLRHDLFYVQHIGISLYTFCLVKTISEFIGHRAV